MKNKRILVTGGAGFVGSHLCERFLHRGHSVVAVDNLVTGSASNISALSRDKRFSFIRHDVSKPFHVSGEFDAVLHFASPASPPDYLALPIETLLVGSYGTHNALELARTKKARFLMASTSEIYGDPLVNPQPESYLGNVSSIGPRSVYDEAKRYSEAATMAYRRHHKVDAKIVRIFNTYGPRMRPEDGRVIPNFISQALAGKPLTVYGKGRQTRSYCFVTDLVNGLEKLLWSDLDRPVNLGNPNERTVLELGKLIVEMTGSKSRFVYRDLPADDPKVRRPDITLAKKALGWEPKTKLRDGLAVTIDYFRGLLRR
jgi:dTDP-glucose 4,6-dehydratase